MVSQVIKSNTLNYCFVDLYKSANLSGLQLPSLQNKEVRPDNYTVSFQLNFI